MTLNGWAQIALFAFVIVAHHPAARRLHDARVQRRAHLPFARAAAGRARDLLALRRRRKTRAALADLCRRHAVLQRRRFRRRFMRCSGCRPCCRSTRRAVERSAPDLAFNTSISFITNTNWQSYTPETTMSYLAQMAGLTVHNFVSAATGIALALALIRGFARRSAQDGRQFLGRSDPLHALRAAADLDRRGAVLRLAGHAAEPRRLHRRDDARRRQADHRARPGRLAGSHQDARAPMAAASSTPTPPIRSRTRTR